MAGNPMRQNPYGREGEPLTLKETMQNDGSRQVFIKAPTGSIQISQGPAGQTSVTQTREISPDELPMLMNPYAMRS